MQTAKTDQTGQMPRLIWVFAGCTCHFVDFVMRQLKCQIARDEWTFSFVGHALTWLHDIKDMSVYGSVNCPALSNSLEVKFVTGTVFVFRFSRHFFRGLWCAPIMKASLWPWASPWKTDISPTYASNYSNEPPHDKTNKMTCMQSKDSDQPGLLPSLIRVFAVGSMGS